MKKKIGAFVSIVLSLTLVLSLATTALAGSGSIGKGNKSQFSVSGGGFDDKAAKKDAPKFGQPPKGNPSFTNGSPEDAIAALSDEDKETLSEYIEAYEEAVADAIAAMEIAKKGDDLSQYRKAVMTALKNLLKAAKDAGINLKASMCSAASINGQLHRNWNGKDFSNKIEEALAALSDEDKETLSDVIEAYEEAVAAAKEAKENCGEDADLSSYREAVADALKDLLDAAKEADIDLGLKEFTCAVPGTRIGGYFSDAIDEAIANLDEDDSETLSDYIEAYEDAVAAAEEAAENTDDDDELCDYRDAVVAALKDLLRAANEADIDLELLKASGR